MKHTYKFGCFLLTVICLLSLLFSCGAPARTYVLTQDELLEDRAPAENDTEERNETSEETPLEGSFAPSEGDGIDHADNAEETPQIQEKIDPTDEVAEAIFTYPASDSERYEAVCAKTGVNVRAGRGTNTAVIGYLGTGRSLPYLGTEDGWYRVWADGAVGYISAAYTYLADTCRAIESIVDAGLDKLGTPYVWGAPRIIDGNGNVSPYFTGKSFDCSSFVQYCYYVGYGVKLGNYTGSQADYTVGKVLTRYADLRRGDFYFTGSGSISHVVIYMGGGRLLQAYSANGGPVSFTTDERWKGKFISGRSVDLSVKEQYAAKSA